MRTKHRLEQLETRLRELEEAAALNQAEPALEDHGLHELIERFEQVTASVQADKSEQLSALSDLRGHLAVQADRLASLSLKLDMTHSRVERIDRIQDEVRQTQEEHTDALNEIRERTE